MTSIKFLTTVVCTKKEFTRSGLAVFADKTLTYSIRHESDINDGDAEALCIEIFNAKSKSIFIKTIYRQPAGAYNEFET